MKLKKKKLPLINKACLPAPVTQKKYVPNTYKKIRKTATWKYEPLNIWAIIQIKNVVKCHKYKYMYIYITCVDETVPNMDKTTLNRKYIFVSMYIAKY